MRPRLLLAPGPLVLAVLALAGCDRPFVEETVPAVQVLAPNLSVVQTADSISLVVRASTFRPIAQVTVNGQALRYGADSLWTGRVGLASGLNPLVVQAVDAGGAVRERTTYALRTRLTFATVPISVARAGHAAVRLQDGRILVSGGFDRTGSSARSDAFLLDVSSGTPVVQPVAGAMQAARGGHTATLLPDGRVLIAGGVRVEGQRSLPALVTSVEVFDPARQTFSALPVQGAVPRNAYHQAVVTRNASGDAFVGILGGEGPTSNSTSARYGERSDLRFFRVDPNAFVAIGSGATSGFGASVGDVLSGFSATVLEGTGTSPNSRVAVFASTRVQTNDSLLATALGFGLDLDGPTFTPRTIAPPPKARHRHAAARIADGLVLVTGGADDASSGTVPAAASLFPGGEIYSATANQHFAITSSLGRNRYGHTATALGDGRVLLYGGFDGTGNALSVATLVDTGLR